jgi:hypothetical protein
MTAGRLGDFVLTADPAGSGHFLPAGTIPNPAPQLTSALEDLKDGEADPELRDALVYALAAKVAGRCVFESPQAAKIAEACFEARLISEWRISIPGAGILQAFFHVAKLERKESDGIYEIALRLAGKPSFAAAQHEIVESSWR